MIRLTPNLKQFLNSNQRTYFPLRIKMSSNIEKFSTYLVGDWNNYQQSQDFPALWSHIHVCYQKLPSNFMEQSSFYVESAYDYSLDKPYKTGVIAIQEVDGKIEMQNFKVKQPEKFWYGSHDPSLLKNLEPEDLIKLPNICDTIFEYDNEKDEYEGQTRPGKKCIIQRGDKQTYLDSRIIVSKNSYSSWDIGRDLLSDEQIWGATSGPFYFKKSVENKS